VWADSRKDELVSINIVTAMMLTTVMLSAAALGKLDELVPALRRLPEQMAQVVRQASARAEEMWDYFNGIRPIYLIYRGLLKGSAFNGRLVLEEIARTPGIAMEAGDFRQGPNEVIDERFGALLFVSGGHQGKLNLSLGRDIRASGGKVMMVGRTNGWQEVGGLSFDIDDVPEELLPVLATVPAQLLAYKLAEHQGYTPGEVRYISKVILTEEGIPNG
jgi:glucosamine--fructose-6-phosphate aminotransferase (isomerizing)